jgi:dephospho-CoA kinase
MRIIGLTGGIGMGKSTVAAMIRRLGIPVSDADAMVHRLLSPGGKAFLLVRQTFPESFRNGIVDRAALGKAVFADPGRLRQLEAILHPMVRRERDRFLALCRRQRRRIAVLDIPLLFETSCQAECDAVMVVSAPEFIRRSRVLVRPGMTPEKLAAIMARQMPDTRKRRLADEILQTGCSRGATFRQLQAALKRLDSNHARNRPRYRNNRR